MESANLCRLKQISLIILLSRTSGYGTLLVFRKAKILQMASKFAHKLSAHFPFVDSRPRMGNAPYAGYSTERARFSASKRRKISSSGISGV